jgi:hypothetical protein
MDDRDNARVEQCVQKQKLRTRGDRNKSSGHASYVTHLAGRTFVTARYRCMCVSWICHITVLCSDYISAILPMVVNYLATSASHSDLIVHGQ